MKTISFNITAEEVKSLSPQKLTPAQVRKALALVETDEILRDNIKDTISDNIRQVVGDIAFQPEVELSDAISTGWQRQ